MREITAEFGGFGGRLWFNTAHQGPLPAAAVAAARVAAELKAAPHRLADTDFAEVPERLRTTLARLVGGAPEEIVLGNSTSYGMHAVANGLTFAPDDEVLVIAGDYPATVLPWQRVTKVRAVPADELADAIGPRTRVVAVTWVDSFTGRALDLATLKAACADAGALLVVNGSQAVGARSVDLSTVDVLVSCGYKWLCGPYGTGFAWIRPEVLMKLKPRQAYWLAMHAGRGLDVMRDTTLRTDLGVRAFDVFCPADFGNTLPWLASLDLLLDIGIDAIAEHDQHLVDRFVSGLDRDRYRLVSPAAGPTRSTLVVLSAVDGDTAARHHVLTEAGVDTAFREGNLRLSMHLFNTPAQVDRVLELLHDNQTRP